VVTALETWRDMPSTTTWGDIDATLACALTATSGAEGPLYPAQVGIGRGGRSPRGVRACGHRTRIGVQL